ESLEIKPLADEFYKAGFSLHMDDFGSGRSSLNELNLLHFDVVKLDKSLIDFIGEQRGDMILMYTMALGKELGLHLVAEGVEDEKQIAFLRENGCDTIQGYYYSKPLPPEEFEKKVKGNFKLHTQYQNQEGKYKLISMDTVVKRAMVRMLHQMPGGFFTYEADGDERILSSNQYLWNLFGCDTEEEFMEYVGGSFKGIVCPEELERVEESIKKQIEGSANDMDYVEYHIIKKDGTRTPVVDYGHLDRLEEGNIFYVFISEIKK
ncbi:MAG: EAL domain-containing protein, partial [Lachnospiraceae bacterium]